MDQNISSESSSVSCTGLGIAFSQMLGKKRIRLAKSSFANLPGCGATALSCDSLAAVSDCLASDNLVEVCDNLCDALRGLEGRLGLRGLPDPVSESTCHNQEPTTPSCRKKEHKERLPLFQAAVR